MGTIQDYIRGCQRPRPLHPPLRQGKISLWPSHNIELKLERPPRARRTGPLTSVHCATRASFLAFSSNWPIFDKFLECYAGKNPRSDELTKIMRTAGSVLSPLSGLAVFFSPYAMFTLLHGLSLLLAHACTSNLSHL